MAARRGQHRQLRGVGSDGIGTRFCWLAGWELITIYDKASNWMQGMEKGFMLLKRPVAPETKLEDDEWCKTINLASGSIPNN